MGVSEALTAIPYRHNGSLNFILDPEASGSASSDSNRASVWVGDCSWISQRSPEVFLGIQLIDSSRSMRWIFPEFISKADRSRMIDFLTFLNICSTQHPSELMRRQPSRMARLRSRGSREKNLDISTSAMTECQ